MSKPYQSHPGVTGDSDTVKKLQALKLPNLEGKSFLDIGCSEGFFCGYAKMQGAKRVIGIDSQFEALEKAREFYPDVEFRCQSWDTLPEGKFDVILHSSAMHHVVDPYAHLSRIHDSLTEDGLLVLEISYSPFNHAMESGMYELGGAIWERSFSQVESVYHPSEALLRSDLLTDFSVRAVGRSVTQKGDPLPRKVFHCRPFKPIVLIIGGASGSGKTTLTVEMQRHGVPSLGSDFVLEILKSNRGKNKGALWEFVHEAATPYNGTEIYTKIATSHLVTSFAAELVNMIPRKQRLLIIEGYAFSLIGIRKAVVDALQKRGYKVHRLDLGL